MKIELTARWREDSWSEDKLDSSTRLLFIGFSGSLSSGEENSEQVVEMITCH